MWGSKLAAGKYFAGVVAAVTGATQGIRLIIAEALRGHGAPSVPLNRNSDVLAATAVSMHHVNDPELDVAIACQPQRSGASQLSISLSQQAG